MSSSPSLSSQKLPAVGCCCLEDCWEEIVKSSKFESTCWRWWGFWEVLDKPKKSSSPSATSACLTSSSSSSSSSSAAVACCWRRWERARPFVERIAKAS